MCKVSNNLWSMRQQSEPAFRDADIPRDRPRLRPNGTNVEGIPPEVRGAEAEAESGMDRAGSPAPLSL